MRTVRGEVRALVGLAGGSFSVRAHEDSRQQVRATRQRERGTRGTSPQAVGTVKASAVDMHVNPARPVVKVRVYSETFGVVLNVDVAWDRYAELRLQVGDTVYVAPRQVRLFVQEYTI